MSVNTQVFHRALTIYPNANVPIPYPQVIRSGQTTQLSLTELIDTNADFVANNVKSGDIIFNTTSGTSVLVDRVINANKILLVGSGGFNVFLQDYTIYANSSQTSNGNPGCCLYLMVNDDVTVQTIGGDVLTFKGLKSGTILPVQIVKLLNCNNAPHIALW